MTMQTFAWTMLVVCWFAWGYPFIFRAPHNQKRDSVTIKGPTQFGMLLEGIAIFLAFAVRIPQQTQPEFWRVAPALLVGLTAAVTGWTAVAHLGKQFRVHAGLYEDHELVRTGPYSVVRHPIYGSLLAMLLCTLLILTPWEWMPLFLAIFIAGTEIRIRSEDTLLESRFGDEFRKYRKEVRAYIPFVR